MQKILSATINIICPPLSLFFRYCREHKSHDLYAPFSRKMFPVFLTGRVQVDPGQTTLYVWRNGCTNSPQYPRRGKALERSLAFQNNRKFEQLRKNFKTSIKPEIRNHFLSSLKIALQWFSGKGENPEFITLFLLKTSTHTLKRNRCN